MASGLIRSQLSMASKINKTSIYVDVQELFITLYDAQFEMPKRDRPNDRQKMVVFFYDGLGKDVYNSK